MNVRRKVLMRKRKPDNRESTSRADGASLVMGSSEYRERRMDLMGMDEFEQEACKLADAGLREPEKFVPEDEAAKAYAEKMASFSAKLDKTFEDVHGSGVLTPAELKTSHEIRKSLLVDDAVAGAAAAAALTESEDDDKYVAHELPKRLEKAVYDEGEDEEDIYPGMSTLEKYM